MDLWIAKIADRGKPGIISYLPDLATVLELIYEAKRADHSQVVQVQPAANAHAHELEKLRAAGADIEVVKHCNGPFQVDH